MPGGAKLPPSVARVVVVAKTCDLVRDRRAPHSEAVGSGRWALKVGRRCTGRGSFAIQGLFDAWTGTGTRESKWRRSGSTEPKVNGDNDGFALVVALWVRVFARSPRSGRADEGLVISNSVCAVRCSIY
eukprot:4748295-Pyramimonas_sp.AAC.1